MNGRVQKIGFFIEYAAVRVAGFCLNLFPLTFLLQLARPAGKCLFWLLPRSRVTALENLRQAYGSEKSPAELRRIAYETFAYLTEFAFEWLAMPKIARQPERYLGIRGVEKIHDALKGRKGAILLVSHGGNWEIMALIAGLLIAKPVNATIYALARPLKNPYLYDYVLTLRGLTGLKSISKIGAVRETLKRLKENAIISLLVDQRVSEGSVETEFFGREALTTSLPAIAALRLGTPIFHVFLPKTRALRYVMEVEGPVPFQTSGDYTEDIRRNTQRFNDRLEAEIRKNPGHWLWMHNRWRARHGLK